MLGRLHQTRRTSLTLCPIAVVAGCAKCPAVSVCPLKTALGDAPKRMACGRAWPRMRGTRTGRRQENVTRCRTWRIDARRFVAGSVVMCAALCAGAPLDLPADTRMAMQIKGLRCATRLCAARPRPLIRSLRYYHCPLLRKSVCKQQLPECTCAHCDKVPQGAAARWRAPVHPEPPEISP